MRTDSLGREELLSVSHQNDIEAVNLYLDYASPSLISFSQALTKLALVTETFY